MRKTILLLCGVLALSTVLAALTNIPVGTVIPVRLSSALDAKHCKPGDKATAKVAQDVPLYNGAKIKAGSRVLGEVLAITPPQNSQPGTIELRFNQIDVAGQMLPLSTDLRAIASPDEVRSAQEPTAGTDRGSMALWDWTTVQIGGDVVYRGGGPVASGVETVGTPVYGEPWGVLARVSSSPGSPCRGPIAGDDKPQALWVFSHDACGVYGYDFTIADAGRTTNKIVLESRNGDLRIQRGTAMLLRVNGDIHRSPNEVVSK